MSFKKIDEDCINGDQPYDSYLLKGIVENMRSAYVFRPKRGSISFANDIRPQFGCNTPMILPLCVFPLSEGAKSANVRLFLDILDYDVIIKPVLLSTDGKTILWEGTEAGGDNIYDPGYDQFIDLYYNTQGIYRLAVLGISLQSLIDDSTKITIGNSLTDVTLRYSGRLEFFSAVTDLDPDKRQVIEVTDEVGADNYDVISVPPSKESCRIYPFWYPRPAITDTSVSFVLATMGSIRISGMTFKEGFDNTDLSFGTAFDPASPTATINIQRIAGQQREFYKTRGAIHHIGPTQFRNILDVYDDTYSRYGTRILANDQTWRTISTDVLVQRGTDKIEADSVVYSRTRTAVAGILDSGINRTNLSGSADEYIDMQVRAVCYTFNRTNEKWEEDEEFYERSDVRVRIKEGEFNWIYQDYRSYHLGLYPRDNFSDLPKSNIRNVFSNFSVFYFDWDDSYSEDRRRVMIQANGGTETISGKNIVGYDFFAYCPTITIWTPDKVA